MPKKKHNYTDWDDWWDEYKPVLNHFHNDENESFNGCTYQVRGIEGQYIDKKTQEDEHYVWTMLQCDGIFIITQGWHYVNREYYLITEKPWKDGDDFNIIDEYDLKKALRRERYLITGK